MILSVLALSMVINSAAEAENKTLKLRDGRQMTGEITKTEDGYLVTNDYGTAKFTDSEVLEVVEEVSPLKEYQQRLAKIDPNSADAHFELGRWAMGEKLWGQARDEFRAAVAIRPGFETASLMLRQAEIELEKNEQRRTRKAAAAGGESASRPSGSGEEEVKDEWLLSEDDINRIRLEELRATDKVRIEFANDVLTRYIESRRGSPDWQNVNAAFRGKPPIQRVIEMLTYVDRQNTSIRDDIRVQTDPQFMVNFRQIWPSIGNQCAVAECHGGSKPVGGLKLFRGAGRDDRVDYTNFIILDGMVSRDGKARLINRSDPEKSLLLQYGLLPDQADFRHPEKLRRPIFTSRSSPSFKSALKWVTLLRGPMHPDYRLEYTPPFGMKLDFASSPSVLGQPTIAPPAPSGIGR
jgi:hypothetical protein